MKVFQKAERCLLVLWAKHPRHGPDGRGLPGSPCPLAVDVPGALSVTQAPSSPHRGGATPPFLVVPMPWGALERAGGAGLVTFMTRAVGVLLCWLCLQ